MQTFEQRRFVRTIAVGAALTLLVCLVHRFALSALDGWFYDQRAIYAQFGSKRPDLRIEHVDIDEAALDAGAVGRWPWSHSTMAKIIEEIGRANPKALGLDIYLSDPEKPEPDAELATALSHQKNLVLIADLEFPQEVTDTPEQALATKEMTANLELSPADLLHRIRLVDIGKDSTYDIQNLYVRARKSAMRIRVARELQSNSMDDEQLIRRLLPHTEQGINSTIIKVLKAESAAYRAGRSVRRFGIDSPALPIPAPPTAFRTLNLEAFTRSAKFSGFVNYDMFKSSVVRSVPLFVESDHILYPQFGFAFACAILGADPREAIVDPYNCTVPVPGGSPITIPTHLFHSETLKRDVSSIIDIPWFGGSDWLTMYDWPTHTQRADHISVNVVWDICKTIENINTNNRLLNTAISDLFSGEGILALDNDFYVEYAKSIPSFDDAATFAKIAAAGLVKLKDSGMIEIFSKIPAGQRTPLESTQLVKMLDDQSVLINVPKNNAGLNEQIVQLRKKLKDALEGKGVLFGWTAEGLTDHVNTSLHLQCPGVVVHGVIAESVLSGRWWHLAPEWIGYVISISLGLVTAFLVEALQPMRAGAATVALLIGYILLNCLALFDAGKWLVPLAWPVVTILVVWAGCTLQRVILEGVERNRVATEVAIINREMDLARKVQAALIPTKSPVIPGLEADGWTMAASVAGGDCYDLWTLPDGRLGILLADASGHGLAPAMVVSQVRTLVRAMCDVERHPHDLLKRINARIAEDLEPGRFVTAFLGFLSSDGQLEYASAGHGPQFWYGCDGNEMEILDSTGAPLGSDNEWLCDDPLPPIQMGAGCSLVVFSDGIFEAMTPAGELFGIERLKEILHGNRGKSGKAILKLVIDAMQIWQHKRPPADDQTVVIARRIPVAARTEAAVEMELEVVSQM